MEGFVQKGGWGRRPGAKRRTRAKPAENRPEDGLACGPNRAPCTYHRRRKTHGIHSRKCVQSH